MSPAEVIIAKAAWENLLSECARRRGRARTRLLGWVSLEALRCWTSGAIDRGDLRTASAWAEMYLTAWRQVHHRRAPRLPAALCWPPAEPSPQRRDACALSCCKAFRKIS